MRLGPLVIISLAAGLFVTGLSAPANAADPAPTTLSLTAGPAYAGGPTTLQVDLRQADGPPVAAGQVLVERRVSGEWRQVDTVLTDTDGHAEVTATLNRSASNNVFRATYAGDDTRSPSGSGPVTVPLIRRNSVLVVGGPGSVVDEKSVLVTVRWTTGNGSPVSGRLKLFRRTGFGDWSLAYTLRTGQEGRAQVRIRPRSDTRWRAVVDPQDWLEGATSKVHRVDNLPPGRPVRLPAAAPRPRIALPKQPRADGRGPNVVITRIPNGVWADMTGVSWRRGCPVGRAGLRYLRINYWDYSGYRRRGELVANADAVRQMAAALSEMYERRLPVRAMYRVDRFGYSGKLHGADDYRSMASGNTSAFNCRDVVNRPGVRSPHSWGRSLDLNTWENPFRSARGVVPNRWWMSHSHPRVAWRSRSHAVVKIMARHGLRWTYGLGDTQHFDAPTGDGRVLLRPDCLCVPTVSLLSPTGLSGGPPARPRPGVDAPIPPAWDRREPATPSGPRAPRQSR